jgi:hypothetical protein
VCVCVVVWVCGWVGGWVGWWVLGAWMVGAWCVYLVEKLKVDRPLKSKGFYGNRGTFHKEPHGNIQTRGGDIWLLGRSKCWK